MRIKRTTALGVLLALALPAVTLAQAPPPELIAALTKELSATPDQAQGAAGALFGLAKTRLKPDEFSQVANAVPGMDTLLKAAPAVEAKKSGADALLQGAAGAAGLGGLASVAGSFTKLGLKPELATKAVPILVNHVTKAGSAEAGKLLAGALR